LGEVLDRVELTVSHVLGITTDNGSANYLMTPELQPPLDHSGFQWPAMRNHIVCMAHIVRCALCGFISSLGVIGRTKSLEAHKHNQQFGEIKSTVIGKSQRLGKDGNARINKVSALRLVLGKIIEKVQI